MPNYQFYKQHMQLLLLSLLWQVSNAHKNRSAPMFLTAAVVRAAGGQTEQSTLVAVHCTTWHNIAHGTTKIPQYMVHGTTYIPQYMAQHVSCGTLDSEHIQHFTTWHNLPQYITHGTTHQTQYIAHGPTYKPQSYLTKYIIHIHNKIIC